MVTAAGYFLPMLEATGTIELFKRVAIHRERKYISRSEWDQKTRGVGTTHAVGSSALALRLDLLSSRANNVKGGRRNSSTSSQSASGRERLISRMRIHHLDERHEERWGSKFYGGVAVGWGVRVGRREWGGGCVE
jgi:hypothetical protein